MLQIKTYVGPSSIHGLGLFAAEDIQKDSIVWQYTTFSVQKFNSSDFLKLCGRLPHASLITLLDHFYKYKGEFYYLNDNTRFINHSGEASNLKLLDNNVEIASRKISTGEELLENYHQLYDPDDFFFLNLDYKTMTNAAILSRLGELYQAAESEHSRPGIHMRAGRS